MIKDFFKKFITWEFGLLMNENNDRNYKITGGYLSG